LKTVREDDHLADNLTLASKFWIINGKYFSSKGLLCKSTQGLLPGNVNRRTGQDSYNNEFWGAAAQLAYATDSTARFCFRSICVPAKCC
jgi:hypothetical protein